LRLGFLMISGLFGWLRLSRCEESWRSAEILLLRHQLRVLQRQIDGRPKVTWADRALIVLLLDLIPKGWRTGLRLFVSPETVLRWRRDILRRRWIRRSQHKQPGRPRTRRTIRALVV
jgi:putative transposase